MLHRSSRNISYRGNDKEARFIFRNRFLIKIGCKRRSPVIKFQFRRSRLNFRFLSNLFLVSTDDRRRIFAIGRTGLFAVFLKKKIFYNSPSYFPNRKTAAVPYRCKSIDCSRRLCEFNAFPADRTTASSSSISINGIPIWRYFIHDTHSYIKLIVFDCPLIRLPSMY